MAAPPPAAETDRLVTASPAMAGPRAVLPLRQDWPLHDVAASRAVEQSALATAAPHTLMARAGQGLARLALATQPGARRAAALAGPGNNGGDAVVAAALLARAGWAASVVLVADPGRLPADARWALDQARDAGLPIGDAWPAEAAAEGNGTVFLDGLLGLGANRAPTPPLQGAIDRLAKGRSPVLAVDIPSGLDPDRGTVLGPLAVRADHTLCLLTLKPGLFTAQGRDHAGRVWLDDLGLLVDTDTPWQLGGVRAARRWHPPAPHASHKGRFGDLGVLAGGAGMGGAAVLAAQAALTAGAGRVYVALLDREAPPPQRPELMTMASTRLLDPAWLDRRTLLAGCGGGQEIGPVLPPALAHAARLVLDADALNAVAREPGLARALAARGSRGRPTVLTPHPLEAARLLGTGVTVAEVQGDRLRAARELADRYRAVVVLKGSGSVIAGPHARTVINGSGNGLLASPGTGDVLAGWLAGTWARHADAADPIELAAAAVHRHGRAADTLAVDACPPPSLLAGDLAARMAVTPD